MKHILAILAFFSASSCASTSQSGLVARDCGKTAVQSKEMQSFGFTPAKDKIQVVRLMATWCPYCKDDLAQIGKRFKSGEYTPEKVSVLLISYKNRRETKDTYTAFVRDTLPQYGIPSEAVQFVFVDKGHDELVKIKGGDGKPLFEGWQGVPFGLVFGKDGRLVFRGQFTQSPPVQEEHYRLIGKLTSEKCKS